MELVETLKGKTAEEILEIRPHLHPRVVDEFVKLHPTKKAIKPKKKKVSKEDN